jgi:hypothetical protein
MATIRTARTIVGALITAAALSACASRTETYEVVDAAEIDKGCILSASDKLRQLIHVEAADGRALPAPDGKPNHRVVELDATNVKIKVTYVFV